MSVLTTLDLVIIVASVAICFLPDFFRHLPRHVFKVPALRLSPAHELHGTHIRWARL